MDKGTKPMTLVINEGVLNDDKLMVAAKGCHFGSNRTWVYAVRYWTYANEWCDHEHVFYAKSVDNAVKRYIRETGREVTVDTYESLLVCASDFREE